MASEYTAYYDVFFILAIATGITYVTSFLGTAMTAARYFRIQLPFFIVVTAATFLACFWLIPAQGLRGAAIVMIVSGIVKMIGSVAIIAHAVWKCKGIRYQEVLNLSSS